MTSRDAIQSELRAVLAEAIGALRTVAEGTGPLTAKGVKVILDEAQHAIEAAYRLPASLP